jgi:hypothetical protein
LTRRLGFLAFAFAALSLAPSAATRAAADERPNILFLIADDWGWNHSGAAGCRWVKTPTFDRIAREMNNVADRSDFAAAKALLAQSLHERIRQARQKPRGLKRVERAQLAGK